MPAVKTPLMERIPPQDLDAEIATLGSMLLESSAAGLAAEELLPEDFYSSVHQAIFKTICAIYDAGQQPDEVILRDRLKGLGLLEKVGGDGYLDRLTNSVPSAANLEDYVRIVREKALARSLVEAGTAIQREAEKASNIRESLDRAEQRIFELAGHRATRDIHLLKDLLKLEFEEINRRRESPGSLTGLATHIPALDDLTGGFQKSDFIILAARPSVGKTALALNMVEHIADRDHAPVLIFTLEMAKEQVAKRLLASRCKIEYQKLRSGKITDAEYDRIVHMHMGPLSELPVHIDDTPSISVMELRSKARRMKSQHDIGMVVVDYLQLMRSPPGSRNESRDREVAKISAGLKALARELNIPVMALSQIRRAAEDREHGLPQLSDLRESGSLEQDADVVMILHRPKTMDKESVVADLIVAKQRNGPTDDLKLTFKKEFMYFGPFHPDRP